jgi:hypothetical protein
LITIRHPEYDDNIEYWEKYADAYAAGHDFVEDYVEMFSTREDATDFVNRKKYSYCPAFAKEAINEIKNSIFQRITDVTREGSSDLFKHVYSGKYGGVDLQCSSMNAFIGREILPELLVKAKVGVFVDSPALASDLKINGKKHPYLYTYRAEDILSWEISYDDNGYYFSKLLLREYIDDYDEDLPCGVIERYRYLYLEDGVCKCKFFDKEEIQVDSEGVPTEEDSVINIPIIPFVVAELTHSLMEDIADYQVAMTNLASSDMSYALRANFPFYVEQVDLRLNNNMLKKEGDAVGVSDGRSYPMGAERPSFINPSSEPLDASMKKQATLKEEIRQLVHLALTNIEPKMASAESKAQDQQGLEAGLSYIGLELETLERMIARIWVMYEGSGTEITIVYPKRYSLKSDDEKRKEAKELKELLHDVPGTRFKRAITKRIATVLLSDKLSTEDFDAMIEEINTVDIFDTDPDVIQKDTELGLVDLVTASQARGYPEGCVDLAKQEHAERLARIAASQSSIANRGVKDLQEPKDSKDDKK